MSRVSTQTDGRTNSSKLPRWISTKRIIFSAAVAASLVSLLGQRHFVFSQQVPNSGFDTQARSRDIVAHLNSVIKFYRASIQPIQKTGEPTDVVYRDQATTLSSLAAQFAIQSARPEAVLMAQYLTGPAAARDLSVGGEEQKCRTPK